MKKVDLKKEAKKQVDDTEIEGEVTEEILLEHCPKEFLAQFKKAKTAAARADLLYLVDEERLRVQKSAEAIKKFVSKLEKWFIQELPEDDATGVAGKVARVQLKKKSRPSVVDWGKFYAHIKKKGEFELLNRAPNAKSIKERWEQGKEVPGIEQFIYSAVSVTKVK
jgi:hypothetical protein